MALTGDGHPWVEGVRRRLRLGRVLAALAVAAAGSEAGVRAGVLAQGCMMRRHAVLRSGHADAGGGGGRCRRSVQRARRPGVAGGAATARPWRHCTDRNRRRVHLRRFQDGVTH